MDWLYRAAATSLRKCGALKRITESYSLTVWRPESEMKVRVGPHVPRGSGGPSGAADWAWPAGRLALIAASVSRGFSASGSSFVSCENCPWTQGPPGPRVLSSRDL